MGAPIPSTTPRVTIQFGRASAETHETGWNGFAVQVDLERVTELRGTPADAQPEHVVAVMDGRTVWPDSFERAREVLAASTTASRSALCRRRASSSCPSLLRVRTCRRASSSRARRRGRSPPGRTRSPADAAIGYTAAAGGLAGGRRADAAGEAGERKEAQSDLDLPAYPTTTTGSLPQTAEVRQLRVRLGKGSWSRPTTKPKWRASSPTGWLAGAHRPGRDRPRRVRADRHGRVLRRADGRLHDPRRVGALVREPMRARRSSPRRRPSASR